MQHSDSEALYNLFDDETRAALAKIKLVIFDVDGTLTDGRLPITDGAEQIRFFDTHDGAGLAFLRHAKVAVGIVSGRRSAAVHARAAQLKLPFCYTGHHDKVRIVEMIHRRSGFTWEQTAAAGDDFPDIPLLLKSSVSFAPASARPEVKDIARVVTNAVAGRGAAREMAELILRAKGRWDPFVDFYTGRRKDFPTF